MSNKTVTFLYLNHSLSLGDKFPHILIRKSVFFYFWYSLIRYQLKFIEIYNDDVRLQAKFHNYSKFIIPVLREHSNLVVELLNSNQYLIALTK